MLVGGIFNKGWKFASLSTACCERTSFHIIYSALRSPLGYEPRPTNSVARNERALVLKVWAKEWRRQVVNPQNSSGGLSQRSDINYRYIYTTTLLLIVALASNAADAFCIVEDYVVAGW